MNDLPGFSPRLTKVGNVWLNLDEVHAAYIGGDETHVKLFVVTHGHLITVAVAVRYSNSMAADLNPAMRLLGMDEM